MTQKAVLELPEDFVREHIFGVCFSFPPAGPICNFDLPFGQNAAISETVDGPARLLFGTSRRIERSEARGRLSTPLWLTSLQKPGVFEVVPTENVSRFGIQMVSRKFWERTETVLVSSGPGFCVQGSVVYCKKLPSEDYILGIRLDAPVEHWIDALGLGEP